MELPESLETMRLTEIVNRDGIKLLRGSLEDNGYERETDARGKPTGLCTLGDGKFHEYVEYEDDADYIATCGLDRDRAQANLDALL